MHRIQKLTFKLRTFWSWLKIFQDCTNWTFCIYSANSTVMLASLILIMVLTVPPITRFSLVSHSHTPLSFITYRFVQVLKVCSKSDKCFNPCAYDLLIRLRFHGPSFAVLWVILCWLLCQVSFVHAHSDWAAWLAVVNVQFKVRAHDVARYCLHSVIKIDKMTSQFLCSQSEWYTLL